LSDDKAIALRVTMIGGQRYPDDFTVIWRGLPIGWIMQASGLPPHVSEWRRTCNFHGKPGDDSESGVDLDDCEAKSESHDRGYTPHRRMRTSRRRTRCGADGDH
jgi:hypothetical protein